MAFVVRLSTPAGIKRLLFKDDKATWEDLLLQASDVTSLPPAKLQVSKEQNPQLAKPVVNPSRLTLAALGIKRGDMFYLMPQAGPAAGTAAASASPKAATEPPKSTTIKLTDMCQHNERGRCSFCTGAEPGKEIKGTCNHGPEAKCIHCSSHVQSKDEKVAVWLCNHPDTAVCPKCAPPPDPEDEKQRPKCDCHRSGNPNQRCPQCLPGAAKAKGNFIPFKQFLMEKRALCKYKHGDTTICASCAPPPLPNYSFNPKCTNGHMAWPRGVCLSCAPAPANVKLQTYRHCNSVAAAMPVQMLIYNTWVQRHAPSPRIFYLFGRFEEEATSPGTPKTGAVRASVHCAYEPPQAFNDNGLRMLRDIDEGNVKELAKSLDLELVGMEICKMPVSGDKYGGKVFMSGDDVIKAAKMQETYHDQWGMSCFVTIVLEQEKKIDPRAYQVSDQCVALVRDDIIKKSPKDINMMIMPKPDATRPAPVMVYKALKLAPEQEFVPDEFIVPVHGVEQLPITIFERAEFPFTGGEAQARDYFRKYSREAYPKKLSDWNLLVFLSKSTQFGAPLTVEIAKALKAKKFSTQLIEAIDRKMMEKQWI